MEWCVTRNARRVKRAEIPVFPFKTLHQQVRACFTSYPRLLAVWAHPDNGGLSVYVALSNDERGKLAVASFFLNQLDDRHYPSLTCQIPEFHLFERELYEDWGIVPDGHPWLKPVRYSHNRYDSSQTMANYPFFHIEGEAIHEVGVGPVHAGVIEPGHFRFCCAGEQVRHLEIQLGYQHRQAQTLFLKGDIRDKAVLAESIVGDTVIGHATAYAQAVETLAGYKLNSSIQFIRGIALELERIGVHLGDLAAIANDIAYLPGSSMFGVQRTRVINTSLAICGSRFGRGWIRPGGVLFGIDETEKELIKNNLTDIWIQVRQVAATMFNNSGTLSRLEQTGVVTEETALSLGLVGMAARSSNLKRDARNNHPSGCYTEFPIPMRVLDSGDVYARAWLRYLEISDSIHWILDILNHIPPVNPLVQDIPLPAADSLTLSLVEGWRGEILHAVITDETGQVICYKIIDPSFHNWNALAMSVRANGISDFPLCNKSFNLSYCGFDL